MRLLTISLISVIATSGLALSSDNSKPCHISSNSMMYQRPVHTTIYKGNVIAIQGTTKVTGDTVKVFTDPKTNRIIEMIAYGQLAHYSTLPDNKSDKLYAQAQVIKYWPQKGQAELIHNAHVTQQHNIFNGDKIFYDIKNQSVYTKATNSRVQTTIVIQPQAKTDT